MAKFQLRGASLGVRKTPYDFKDDNGTRQTGESHVLVLFDEDTTTSHEVKIAQKSHGLFADIPVGTVVDVDVDVFAGLDPSTQSPVLRISASGCRPAPALVS